MQNSHLIHKNIHLAKIYDEQLEEWHIIGWIQREDKRIKERRLIAHTRYIADIIGNDLIRELREEQFDA